MKNLELHPLCTLFPRMSEGDFDSLCSDIEQNGLRQPIVLHEGMILDGGNRYRACMETGSAPAFIEFDGENLVSYVLSANLHRRHLSPGQQAAIVASCADWANAQTVGKPKSGHVAPLQTVADRAAQAGVSERTQKRADKVAKASPELAAKVAHGDISLPKAVEQISPKKAEEPDPEFVKAYEAEEAKPAPEYSELDSLRDQVADLQDTVAAGFMSVSPEDREGAAQLLGDLRKQVANLEIEVKTLRARRDSLMLENGELKKQCAFWRKKADKAEATHA